MDDNRLERIERKLDDTNEHLASIDITLAEQSMILKEHQRRSLANEAIAKTLADELKPVINHVAMMRGALKLVMIAGVVVAIIEALSHLIK